MTRKLFLRLACLSGMVLLLVFSQPATAGQYPQPPSCGGVCFQQYMNCMWQSQMPDLCGAQYDQCIGYCPPEP